MSEKSYRIRWEYSKAGTTGHGGGGFTYDAAKKVVDRANKKTWTGVKHTVELVPEDE